MKIKKVLKWFNNLPKVEKKKLCNNHFEHENPKRLSDYQKMEIFIEEKVLEKCKYTNGTGTGYMVCISCGDSF